MTHETESTPTGILTVPMSVWLELFYDLVFVAAILVSGDRGLSVMCLRENCIHLR